MVQLPNIRPIWLLILFLGYLILTLFNGHSFFTKKNILQNEFNYFDTRIAIGDDLNWAKSDFMDETWQTSIPSNPKNDLWWVRVKINLKNQLEQNKKFGLKISTSGAHELYVDGNYIGRNGEISDSNTMDDPKYYQFYVIPDSLAIIGVHQIALRISSGPKHKMNYPRIAVDEYTNLTKEPLIVAVFIHLLAGIFLFIAGYFIFQIHSSVHKGQFIIFVALCVCILALLIFEYLKFYLQYSVDFHTIRMNIILILTFLVGTLMPVYLLYRFQFSLKLYYIIIAPLLVFLVLYLFETKDEWAYYYIFISVFASIGICLYTIQQLQKKVGYIFLGVLSYSICLYVYYDLTLFISLGFFAILVVFDHLSKMIEEKEELLAAELKSRRLEVELLKTRLQPHFLMNTLTSLIDIIEEDKFEAKEFILSLASLFDIVHGISSDISIPIEKEIDLCKAHLSVMSYRKSVNYSLVLQDIDPNEEVPPAVFLTIIENGLTHNKPINNVMSFVINFIETEDKKVYKVLSTGTIRKINKHAEDGIGNSYIKARLNEYYKEGNWTFITQKEEQGWFTKIVINKKSNENIDS